MTSLLLSLSLLASPCVPLGAPGKAGFPLVVAPVGYENDMAARQDVDDLLRTVLAVQPFLKEPPRAFLLKNADSSLCGPQSEAGPRAFLECRRRLFALADRCQPRAKVLALSRELSTSHGPIAGPGEKAVAVLCTREGEREKLSRVALHELGHAFGLRDELAQVPARKGSTGLTPGPNCAADKEEAARRFGADADLEPGCAGHPDYLRPKGKTAMSGEAEEYGSKAAAYLSDAAHCCYVRWEKKRCAAAAQRHPELLSCASALPRKKIPLPP